MKIILVGMMGSGKTKIGRALSKFLDLEFIDLDHAIESHTGVKVSTIFEIEGEAGFRDRESMALSEILQNDNFVLATGGGAILSDDNRNLILKSEAHVVYLKADTETILHRLKNDQSRPLLNNPNKKEALEKLMTSRAELYESVSNISIDTRNAKSNIIVKKIIEMIKQ
jgi:shikimate kinase